MNIGEIKKNASGQLIGRVATMSFNRTVGFRPILSNNPKAPKFEIVALSDSRLWVVVGALFELASNKTGEIFYQGKIDDPDMAKPLYIAAFSRDDGSMAIAWQRPRRANTEIGTTEYRESDMFEGDADPVDATKHDAGDGLGESTAKPPRSRKGGNTGNGNGAGNGAGTGANADLTNGTGADTDAALPPLVDA